MKPDVKALLGESDEITQLCGRNLKHWGRTRGQRTGCCPRPRRRSQPQLTARAVPR
jgi:hypothetical protein